MLDGRVVLLSRRSRPYGGEDLARFHMYDARGCRLWAADPGRLAGNYHRHREWVRESHRPGLVEVFAPSQQAAGDQAG